ncbi:MAG TPA: 3-methyl-2-oxobutanoate hydroxymethyltransferase [Fibrobacteria bacterium]|nr:3-methyl-2-oxobutanoate hydroxymethyltransferase [Fibrobacteria bacterium]
MIQASEFGRFKTTPMVMATGYDYPFARILEAAGVDVILVGDSLANVVLGLPATRDVDMDVMSVFVAAAARGARNTHILADMPYGSDADPARAVANGRRFMRLGAHSVKLEGAKLDAIRALTSEGVPVVGHLGLLPQTAKSFKQVGASPEERDEVLRSAEALAGAGAIGMVLEHMAYDLAARVTRAVPIPTIGIGAGKDVDGQVLVLHDFLGLHPGPFPPFAKAFAGLHGAALAGAQAYCRAVRGRTFPEK